MALEAANDLYTGLRELRSSLPARSYFDPDIYRLELTRIWRRSWINVCRSTDLDAPLAFRVETAADVEVLLVRGEDGTLRAFHNSCRHRGASLCTTSSGRLAGRLIVCPYHAWSYATDGRLVRAPSKRMPEGFDKRALGLIPIEVEEWRGFVFVRLDGSGSGSVQETFDAGSSDLANWPLERLVVGHTYRKLVASNWKVFWENFNECLHCPGVHKSLSALVPIYGRGLMARHDDPDWESHADSDAPEHSGGLRVGAQSWTVDGRVHAPPFPGLSPADIASGQSYATHLPSMFIVGHADYVRAVRVIPCGPEQIELVADWLFLPEALPLPRAALDAITGLATQVLDEDAEVCELNQRGLRSAGHKAGVLMPEEYDVARFQDWVRKSLEP